VAKIYSIISSDESNTRVSLDENLESPEGPRQFDVVIRSTVAGIEILTVVEVRDWNKNLSVTHVDGLHSKMRDVNANKAILVSRKGFSAKAVKKAGRLGIDLCTAHDLHNIEKFTPKAPVVVHAMEFDLISIDFSINAPGTFSVDYMQFKIGGISILDLFRNDLATQKYTPIICEDRDVIARLHSEADRIQIGGSRLHHEMFREYLNTWETPIGSELTYIDPHNGIVKDVRSFQVSFLMRYDYYFGYLNDLPGTIALDSISGARADIFYLEEDLSSFDMHFSKFTKKADVPVKHAANIFSLAAINFESLPNKKFTQQSLCS